MFLQLLSEIYATQSGSDNPRYPEGIFPSRRLYKVANISREDDNCFFTALIVFTLQRLEKYLSPDERKIADGIKSKACRAFPLYKNKKGENTYNFWRTEKNAQFPNGKLFSKLDFLRLPDDPDCTAFIYLVNSCAEEDIMHLKNKLVYHAELPASTSRTLLPHYRNMKLYSSWFGTNVPVKPDMCVTANLLYLLLQSKAPLNPYDLDSIHFICSVINRNEHKNQAFRIAPYYPETSIILYHAARLLTVTHHPMLAELKPKLKTDIHEYLVKNIHPMERIILNTALMWLGETEHIEMLKMPRQTDLPWFIAGIPAPLESIFIRVKSVLPAFHVEFLCEAYMKTLFLEYKILKATICP